MGLRISWKRFLCDVTNSPKASVGTISAVTLKWNTEEQGTWWLHSARDERFCSASGNLVYQPSVWPGPQGPCPSAALKNTTRTVFCLTVPWSHSSVLRPHNNDPTPHQKENRGILTLLQNPHNSINKFLSLGKGKEEKVWNLKIFLKYKKKI